MVCIKNIIWMDNYGKFIYIDDKRNGEYKSYYTNGQLWNVCIYIDDNKNGEYKRYNMLGNIQQSCNYVNGKKTVE